MQLKFYNYTIGIYSVVLLMSLVLFYGLPKEGLLDPTLDQGSFAEKEVYDDAAMMWDLDLLEGIHPDKEWRFQYEGNHLKIVSADNGTPQIVVKRTAAHTGEIRAAEYRKATFIAELLNPFQLSLSGNMLSVWEPGRCELKFKAFDKDFTANQFGEKSVQHQERLIREMDFVQELYLYVPDDVEIDYDPDSVFLKIKDSK